jgi:hypothetical protein
MQVKYQKHQNFWFKGCRSRPNRTSSMLNETICQSMKRVSIEAPEGGRSSNFAGWKRRVDGTASGSPGPLEPNFTGQLVLPMFNGMLPHKSHCLSYNQTQSRLFKSFFVVMFVARPSSFFRPSPAFSVILCCACPSCRRDGFDGAS